MRLLSSMFVKVTARFSMHNLHPKRTPFDENVVMFQFNWLCMRLILSRIIQLSVGLLRNEWHKLALYACQNVDFMSI